MYRKIRDKLSAWEQSRTKEPLMVTGARQIGKTWTIREFCEDSYDDWLYINLEERADACSAFSGNLDPDTILRNLSMLYGRQLTEHTTLFLDEIQLSERAITSLKYFCEDKRDFRILCAGSLLGVKLERFESSFPVGKVRILPMYPLDFEEFLLACGETPLRDGIREAYAASRALPEGVHAKALGLYHDYLIIGGMPRIVSDYLAHDQNAALVGRELHENLRLAYLADMAKYVTSPAESVKITDVYDSIPRQLARENPKFRYNEIRPTAMKRDFFLPIDWLTAAGMVLKVQKLDAPLRPLRGYVSENSFKLYLSDVGILTAACGIGYSELLPNTHNIYKGGIIENYVMEQLKAAGKELYYFKPSERMEIDLLLDDGTNTIPVEIKSGRHKRSTSLKNYRQAYAPRQAYRLSELNFGATEELISIPLYAAFCLG